MCFYKMKTESNQNSHIYFIILSLSYYKIISKGRLDINPETEKKAIIDSRQSTFFHIDLNVTEFKKINK
jgi:hypothetical protein